MPTGWTPATASSTLEEWTHTFSRWQQCSCFRITVFYGVRAWSCCHLANVNKTFPRLFTHVISFFKEFYDGWISGVCRPKFTKCGTRVEQSVLNKFFFRITIFCRVRAWEKKVCGRGLKICQILSLFGLPCSWRRTRKKPKQKLI